MHTLRYKEEFSKAWDQLVLKARNSALLHLRPYMDYHRERFEDASLCFLNSKEEMVAVLPACFDAENRSQIISHQGLTFGGLVLSPSLHAFEVEEILRAAINFYKTELGCKRLVLKPAPHIYHSQPSEEELYFLHLKGGKLLSRSLSQAINLHQPSTMSQLRKRCINKAQKHQLSVREVREREGWREFHKILSTVLKERHATRPVHTEQELWLLHSLFERKIKLFAAYDSEQMLAGAVVYFSPLVAHTQYLASSKKGREQGALDLVLSMLKEEAAVESCQYLDFGISTERDGALNYGLALQKEGFGARSVCYDSYLLELD